MRRRALSAALVLGAAAVPPSAAAQEAVAFAVTPETLALASGEPAVTRLYEVEYDVSAPGRAVTRTRLVTTAFGPGGREAAGRYGVAHGGFDRLRRFHGVVRDARGEIVTELDRRDATDALVGSIYEDLRVRSAELYSDRYPFTVEWTHEVEHRGVLGWPTWRPQPHGRPVEAALFTLRVPAGTTVRPRERDVEPLAPQADGRREVYRWRLAGREAVHLDAYGPPWWEQSPELRLGTDRFEIGGAPGRLDSWEAFAAWYHGLSEGRQTLPDAARAEVQRVIAGAETDVEKARRLYRYLQKTTRYVSIQLGLGGWQPFDAEYVYERRYGDCKALTNYMQAMLAEAGIASDPVLIEAGEYGSDLDPAFPDNGFNHVVLRVPMRAPEISADPEAVWLECTSSHAAFGHLGAFTEGRPGLLVTPEGGRIVRTPTSDAGADETALVATLSLSADGDGTADARWSLRGEPRADALARLADRAGAERVLLGLAGRAVTASGGVDLDGVDARAETVRVGGALRVPNVARRAASRLLVPAAPFASAVPALPLAGERTQPLRLGHAYARRDSVRIVPPEGCGLLRAPEAVELEGPAGRYALRAVPQDDGALVVTRELVVSAMELPPEAYAEARAFFAAVAEADASRAVFKRE